MKTIATLILAAALAAIPAEAAAQNLGADSLRFRGGPCTSRAGTGSPEGVQVGKPCDIFIDEASGRVFMKITGEAGTNTGWFPLVGPSAATCTDYASCAAAAASLSWDYLTHEYRLLTDAEKRLRVYVDANGGRLQSYDGSGYRPLWLQGAPVIVAGGGLHVGAGGGASNPGLGNVNLTGFIGAPGFVSQTTGWRIDAAGGADFRYVFTDELHAKAFIADLEQALAGGQIITKSVAVLAADFTVPSAGNAATLVVEDLPSAPGMAVFESGDLVRLRTFSRAAGELSITDAWGTVSAHADNEDGTQDWTFTRLAANGGSMTGGTVIAADAIVLDYGVAGNGWYEVSAVDGAYGLNAPYAQVVTWDDESPAETSTLRARFGNLRGVTSVDDEFGLLAGTYAATGGQYFRASNEAFELHGIDLSMWNGSTKVISIDHQAPYLSVGSPAPTTYGSGTGLWTGIDGGVFKFRVGSASGYFTFDGTTATFAGVGSGLTQINGANIQTGTVTADAIAATTITAAKIAAGTITATQIASDTITAGQIAANAITTSELNADSVTSAKIAAGTIVASDIAASTITADKLNVTSLSAVSANLGTVTAGSISGVTAEFGSGSQAVALNSNGITFKEGSSNGNRVKWDDGTYIESNNGVAQFRSGDSVAALCAADSTCVLVDSAQESAGAVVGSGGVSLGSSDDPWADLYFFAASTTSAHYPLVINGQRALHKTDGVNGTVCTSGQVVGEMVIERGIVTSVSCEAVAPLAAVQPVAADSEVLALRARVEQLERQLADSIAAVGGELRAMNRDLAIILRGGGSR